MLVSHPTHWNFSRYRRKMNREVFETNIKCQQQQCPSLLLKTNLVVPPLVRDIIGNLWDKCFWHQPLTCWMVHLFSTKRRYPLTKDSIFCCWCCIGRMPQQHSAPGEPCRPGSRYVVFVQTTLGTIFMITLVREVWVARVRWEAPGCICRCRGGSLYWPTQHCHRPSGRHQNTGHVSPKK